MTDRYVEALDEFQTLIERRTGRQLDEFPVEGDAKLIIEEAIEADEAIRATDDLGRAPADMGAVAKELADCLYVVFGRARRFSIPIADVFAIVHENNLAKCDGPIEFDEWGKFRRPAGHPSCLPAIQALLASGVQSSNESPSEPGATITVDDIPVDASKAADAVRRCVAVFAAIHNFKAHNKKIAQRTEKLLDGIQMILKGEDATTEEER